MALKASMLSSSMETNFKILRITGFYPVNLNECSKRKFVFHTIYSFLNNFLFLCSQLSQFSYIIDNWSDTEMLFRMIPRVLVQNLSVFEAFVFWIRAKRILQLLKALDETEWNNTNEWSLKLSKYIPIGNIIFSLFPILHGILMGAAACLDENLKLPVDLNVPRVLRELPMKHFLLLFEIYMISTIGVADIAVNTTICGFIAHANAQLKSLRCSIENLGKSNMKKNKKKSTMHITHHTYNMRMKNEFVIYIRHYENIKTFVREIESVFGLIIFFRFVTSGIIICCSILQVNLSITSSIEFLFSMIFLVGMVLELAIFCYFGDILMNESIGISEAAYNCDWIATDISFKRTLLIFMMRTQKPIFINGGKFFKLTRETFVTIMKTAYSYYAVLRTLK